MTKSDKLLNILENEGSLDPNFFTRDNELKPYVRSILLELTNEILTDLNQNYNIDLIPAFVILTGSLCSFEYDEYSDVDFHIGYDEHMFPLSNRELIKKTLSLYCQKWNTNKYTLHNRSLELYFQDADEEHITPGIYDIQHNHWIKAPVGLEVKINGNIAVVADEYKNNIQTMIDTYNTVADKTREFITDTRNNAIIYWQSIRNMRKESIKVDGLYGTGNLVFRQMRRNNALNLLVNFLKQLKQDYIDCDNI
jgi:hypothetical protein